MQKNSGQAAIFVSFGFITLFVLVALSINIGLYINDKINLQNAVDAAAYAGAAEQARLLQEIGYANYELRQLYKRFIYTYRYQFSIGNDRDPVISPSVCVNIPFCDCIVPESSNSRERPWGTHRQATTCGTEAEKKSEMLVSTHGTSNPNLVHQMSWIVKVPYDCDAQTEYNKRQADEIAAYYESKAKQLVKKKLPDLMKLMNEANGRIEKIARKTFFANLNQRYISKAKLSFPKPPKFPSDDASYEVGSHLALRQRIYFDTNKQYRIYYTTWTKASSPGCWYKGKPYCTLYTCVRNHAAKYTDLKLPLWFVKDPNLTTYFTVRAEVPRSTFLIPLRFFGVAPKMLAIAAAKPFGSSIGWPDPYSEKTVVPELYVRDDNSTPKKARKSNQFESDKGNQNLINPSYIDFMEAFYWFDDARYQSLTGEVMPIPLLAKRSILDRLHFTFDSEAFVGQNNEYDRVRFETGWPYDFENKKQGRSGYSVKFIPIRDIGNYYKGSVKKLPEKNQVEH